MTHGEIIECKEPAIAKSALYFYIVKWFLLACCALFAGGVFYFGSEKTDQYTTQPNQAGLEELGHYFFFDKNLSVNGKLACSSCHDPNLAFTDGYRVSLNANAEILQRNSPSILNLNNRTFFSWSDPSINSLIFQLDRPLFSEHPVEMGLKGNEQQILHRISEQPGYKELYYKAFGKSINSIQWSELKNALVAYELKLQSRNSKYDFFLKSNDTTVFTASEFAGLQIFMADSIGCSNCHGGIDFFHPKLGALMANTGLYNCNGSYPLQDIGLQIHTNRHSDNGVFRIPTLRNVLLTAPYYHDGSSTSLEEVIMNYERGGRLRGNSDCNEDGAHHPNRDVRMKKFELSPKQRKNLIAFLGTLTDTTYLNQYYFNDPRQP